MRIFVGWPYDVPWVGEKLVPLIESYGVEVLTGEELHGEVLNDAVKEKIDLADTAIFITTRRKESADGKWLTSDWVVSEIHYAKAKEMKRVLEVREEDVEYPNKLHDVRQYVVMEPGAVADAMLECGKAVGRWKGLMFKLQLLPEEFVKDVGRRIGTGAYKCEYKLRRDGKVIHDGDAEIVREGQGLFVYLHDLPAANAYLELMVDAGERWACAGVQLSALEIRMEKAS